MHSTSGVLGANDGDVLVSLRKNHSPVANYVGDLRVLLPQRFPGVTFYFLPADIVTQILDFGLPSPIVVQVEGNDVVASQQIAEKLMAQMRLVPALTGIVFFSVSDAYHAQRPGSNGSVDVYGNRDCQQYLSGFFC
jgi:hypothetical protein